ncbi:MAG: DUF427 domain-containing protein [Marmoricola sp.]
MSTRQRLEPTAAHPITIEPSPPVRVLLAGRVIAETADALVLREAQYAPVTYIPLEAVDPAVLQPSDHQTYCPFKGDASYYSLASASGTIENAVWTYTDPYEAVAQIAGQVAFYPQHVRIETAPAVG